MIERSEAIGRRLLGATLSLVLLAAASAGASPREGTIAALEALETTWPGADVSIQVVHAGAGPLRIGDDIVYRFASAREGFLTAIHVDTHGATTLLFPRADVGDSKVGEGVVVELPGAEDDFALQVQPPVGRDVVYAIVTRVPLSRRDLGIASADVVVGIEPQDAEAFVRRIRATLATRPADGAAVAHVAQQIDGRGEVLYRSADIVDFFGERTRSIRPPKLDLQIQFSTDSAALDDVARRNIDEFAVALEDPKLADTRFVIAGHTDERGTDAHNLRLSRRRAEAVRRYLVESGGIAADRLEIEAHGETAPLLGDDTEFARAMNRRVEFSPAR
ncbi:MAG: OmpA family protein [Myxococcota bacterium]